ncbi:hypothetical protein [Roseicella aerolata]|uniref:Uncharacterized protein n=1 Tax=Roseicella aerolata TaxID=2883479 RepID=A0A9X1IIL2_9PROT|nr:hypothetical protein [Roseicella aerolata]MCB4824053.1 hypothetical protein [Roseicella aerolata]
MPPSPQHLPRSNAALAAMLLLGNLFFWGCVASRYASIRADWNPAPAQPERIVLLGD